MMELLAIKATSAELRKTDTTEPMLMRCHFVLHMRNDAKRRLDNVIWFSDVRPLKNLVCLAASIGGANPILPAAQLLHSHQALH